MVLTEMSQYSSAVQKDGKKMVDDIQNLHYPCSDRYIRFVCDYVYRDKNNLYDVLGEIRKYDIIHTNLGVTINIKNTPFNELKQQLSKYQAFESPLPNVVYTSPNRLLKIGRLDTYEQAQSVDKDGHWCICNNQKIFDNYKSGYTIYIIHNMELSNTDQRKFLIILVSPDGTKEIYDRNDRIIPIVDKSIIKFIGNGINKLVFIPEKIEEYTIYKENNQYNKNMNMKKTIKLTEADLSNIINEALNELDWRTYANAMKKAKEKGDYRDYKFKDKAWRQFDKDFGFDTREHDGSNRGWTYAGDPFAKKGYPISSLSYHNGIDHGTSAYRNYGLYDFDNVISHRFFRSEEPIVDPKDDSRVMSIPKELDDKRHKGDQELMDYLSGRYHYKKSQGWTKDNLDEAISHAIRKYLR